MARVRFLYNDLCLYKLCFFVAIVAGQTAADRLGVGFDMGSTGSFGGSFGPLYGGVSENAFAQSGQIGLGRFDPLGAGSFAQSWRRKRFAKETNKRVTRGQINKKIQDCIQIF